MPLPSPPLPNLSKHLLQGLTTLKNYKLTVIQVQVRIQKHKNLKNYNNSKYIETIISRLQGIILACHTITPSNIQLALHLQDGLSRVPKLLCLLIIQMHISHTQHSSPPELSRQAKEHITTIDPIKALCEDCDGVDPPLIPKQGSSQVSCRVADGPRCVAFEAYYLIRALNNFFVDFMQSFFLVCNLLAFEETKDGDSAYAYAWP